MVQVVGWAQLMHGGDQCSRMLRVHVRVNAMSQVEDVTTA
jgi:hypothetical protein